MTRTILVALASAAFVSLMSSTGCQASGVGDPCVPDNEYDQITDPTATPPSFTINEASAESGSYQCQTRVCLVNHFQGRVSCPFGQSGTGQASAAAAGLACATLDPTDPNYCGPCVVPGSKAQVPGLVPAQCLDRTAAEAVYCSCRCSDENGGTTGGNFCSCPDGFQCSSPDLIARFGNGDKGLAGGFCIKTNTAYQPGASPCTLTSGTCDPSKDSAVCHQ